MSSTETNAVESIRNFPKSSGDAPGLRTSLTVLLGARVQALSASGIFSMDSEHAVTLAEVPSAR